MRLTILNGSPRGKTGNSELLIQWLTAEMKQKPDVVYLCNTREHDNAVAKLQQSDMAVIVFPLYTDCMPGMVMAFIERLEPLRQKIPTLKLGFVVHSGFPEACQSRAVEKYLVWLTKDLGAEYIGTVVKGQSEGLRHAPAEKTKALFNALGQSLLKEGCFNQELVKKAAGMERLPGWAAILMKVVCKFSFTQAYWDKYLKQNNAYEQRFARPYAD